VSGIAAVGVLAAPLILAALWVVPRWRWGITRHYAWAAMPGLVLAIVGGGAPADLPWLLLGSRLGLDPIGRVMLGLTAGLWLVCGLSASASVRRRRDRYAVFHLLTLAGNLGVTLSLDAVSFATWFTLMSWAAYGLIVHDGTAESHRAGRVYLSLVLAGELSLTWAAVTIAREAAPPFGALDPADASGTLVVGLLLVAFGLKLGLMPLHVWLPLAHPVAPTPASAVLSGSILVTGLLGLMRFLPLGAAPMEAWGAVCVAVGVVTAFGGVAVGMAQRAPKVVLAYSSVSQMGLAAIVLGVGMRVPEAWPAARGALLLFAVHHGVAKAALFLGAGMGLPDAAPVWQRRLWLLAMAVPALALAGVPLTSGFGAKGALKYAVGGEPGGLGTALEWILPLTSAATLALMVHLLALPPASHGPASRREVAAFGGLAAGPVALYAALWGISGVDPAWLTLDAGSLWAAAWPILGAAGLIVLVRSRPEWLGRVERVEIPPGDVVVLLERGVAAGRWAWGRAVEATTAGWRTLADETGRWTTRRVNRAVAIGARILEDERFAGGLLGALVLALIALGSAS
jgi:formate hydrogenlyase subunit 3/multisubunit Na+/H+ antiporter MnhD subunit